MKDKLFGLPKPKPQPEHTDDRLACALNALAESVKLQTEFLRVRFSLATLDDLKKMEKRLLMTAQELETLLNNKTTQIIKISAEQAGRFDTLTAKIAELTALIEAGGAITPAVEAAAAAVGVALDNLDAAIPDAVVV